MSELIIFGIIGLVALGFTGMAIKAIFKEGFHFGEGVDLVILVVGLGVLYFFFKDTQAFLIIKNHLSEKPSNWGVVIIIFMVLYLFVILFRDDDKKPIKNSNKTPVKDKEVVASVDDTPPVTTADQKKEYEDIKTAFLERRRAEKEKPPFEQTPFYIPSNEGSIFYSHNLDEVINLFDDRNSEIEKIGYEFLTQYNVEDKNKDIVVQAYAREAAPILETLKSRLDDDSNENWKYFYKQAEISQLLKEGVIEILETLFYPPKKLTRSEKQQAMFFSSVPLIKANYMFDTPREWVEHIYYEVHQMHKKSGNVLYKSTVDYIEHSREKIYERNLNEKTNDYNEKGMEKAWDDLFGKTAKEAYSMGWHMMGSHFSRCKEIYHPTVLPFSKRFEHLHVLAGSGHGKTQLLQNLISADINNMTNSRMGVIVIDGQGDLIKNILRMKAVHEIKDRVLIVDPEDIENPFCLNPFNLRSQFSDGMTSLDKANLFNSTIQLLTFVFSSLLETKLTAKQETLFNNVLALLVHREGSDLNTMFEVLKDHTPFMADIDQLPQHPKNFFLTEFDSQNYNETRDQVKTRLNAILTKPALASMFSTKENKLNLYDEINRGALILVDTNKDLLKKDGHGLLGRYFIEQILQSALRRKNLDNNKRTPCFVYMDEAQDYLDVNTADLLAQARKYKVSMTLAHQFLDQLTPELKSAFSANTQIKFVGNVNAKDRAYCVRDTGADEKEISSLKKTDYVGAEYILKINTGKPKKVLCKFGVLENFPTVSQEKVKELKMVNRIKYCENISGDINKDFNKSPTPSEANQVTEIKEENTGFSAEDFEDL